MGVTYFFEFLGFILSWIYGNELVENYLVVNNIINALQGVFIFMVLICKRTILEKLVSQCQGSKFFQCLKSSAISRQSNELKTSEVRANSKMDTNRPEDVMILSCISGKPSTASIMSNSTSVTNISTL